MPRLTNLEDLKRLKEEAQREIKVRGDTNTKITVGLGTCGIAAGAREVMHAILHELESNNIEAVVATVGCIGLCAQEPLVDVEQAGSPRITYGKVTPEMVPTIISDHLIKGEVVTRWVVAKGTSI
ncbi:MAG TPA: (2Fe-2S) ferredoxin domain-containing protein [Chloroflexota bacterium]|nr:(2Fe-2S) ferredoxin domain-containing protein [Chloroflexota bacterium]